MASLAASNWPKPVVLVPCLSWSTASNVFTNGVMAQSINWDVLETQYFSDGNYRERLARMVTIVDDAFLAGQRFVQHFNNSILKLKDDIQDAEINKESKEIVNMLGINRTTNTLNISPALLNKLLSKEKCTLTKIEINELNDKIREAQNKWRVKSTAAAAVATEPAKESSSSALEGHMNALQVLQLANGITGKRTESIATFLFGTTTKLMNFILPRRSENPQTQGEKSNGESKEWWERESLQFMRGVMDECTHLKNFSVPLDTELIISVCATEDGYIPREDCISLDEIWPGAEIRYLDAGHVSAYVLHQKLFRSAIIDAFEIARRKYPELLPRTAMEGDGDADTQYLTTNPRESTV